MPEIYNWAGTLSGTSAGTITVEMIKDGTHIHGTLRVFDPAFGRMEAQLIGEWNAENKISAMLDNFRGNTSEGASLPQTGSVEGTYDPFQDVIKGVWRTDAETAGDFCWVKVAAPVHSEPTHAPAPASDTGMRPSFQLLSHVRSLLRPSDHATAQRRRNLLMIALGLFVAIVFGFIMANYLANN